MYESESDYEEESSEEYDEFDAMLQPPPQIEDSDDDTEFPIEFDSAGTFEAGEFEPDITPMCYFLKIRMRSDSDDAIDGMLYHMGKSAKIGGFAHVTQSFSMKDFLFNHEMKNFLFNHERRFPRVVGLFSF